LLKIIFFLKDLIIKIALDSLIIAKVNSTYCHIVGSGQGLYNIYIFKSLIIKSFINQNQQL